MTSSELRSKYLNFFKERGHAIVPSVSLIPNNDPTTLFTGSGMQPMIPFLLGERHPQGARIADSQKCFRSQDIEEVGDNRHTTFFEMLGNWSLGDYFKQEQLQWFFEFAVKELGLDPKNIYVTVFAGSPAIGIPRDDVSVARWKELFASVSIEAVDLEDAETQGMRDGRIFYYGEKKNWWSRSGTPDKMPVGEPGGPDSEMFYDFGAERKLHESSQWKDEPCHVNCDCGRFMEIGNSVFMEYGRTEKGFEKLAQSNVDYGGGLERMMAAANGDPDVFRIDLFRPIIATISRLSGKEYGSDEKTTYAFRVIADHLRAATFLISDEAYPNNKDQGYFTRRLIRRSVRAAHQLGITTDFCADIASAVVREYAGHYPELAVKEGAIRDQLSAEEAKFRKTLEQGLREFDKMVEGLAGQPTISGERAFDLLQTYGFPYELTEEIARERGLMIDREGYEEEKKKHQNTSRAGVETKFKGGLADHSAISIRYHTATHLLQAALRKVLGQHVEQRGSNITPERMRFDFSHSAKMTPEQIQAAEDLVNEQIAKDIPIHFELMTLDEAKADGAIGLFEAKYATFGEKLKVYSMGDFSREVCGGPHVKNAGQLGKFKIAKEEACSAGIRRIKALVENQDPEVVVAEERQ